MLRISADTNVLVRVLMLDNPPQAEQAQALLAEADVVVIGVTALCELTWVLTRTYGLSRSEVAHAIRGLIAIKNVHAHKPVVEAGLRMLDAGGDFADGVIAFEGAWQRSAMFASFDKKAVRLLKETGQEAMLVGAP